MYCTVLFSGQQLAQQMQQSNPELVEQLRSQMRAQPNTGSSDDGTANDDQSHPGSSHYVLNIVAR